MSQQLSNQDIDALLENLKGAPALLTEEELMAVERQMQDESLNGIPRRMLLAGSKFSGAELNEKTRTDRDFAVGVAAVILGGDAWINRQKRLLELAEDVVFRFGAALTQRDDFEEIMAEGDRLIEGGAA